jgi:hypothetical protein
MKPRPRIEPRLLLYRPLLPRAKIIIINGGLDNRSPKPETESLCRVQEVCLTRKFICLAIYQSIGDLSFRMTDVMSSKVQSPLLETGVEEVITEVFGFGAAAVDAKTGAILQFSHKNHPQRRYLLDKKHFARHSAVEHNWGSGHIITDKGTARWNVHKPTSSEKNTYHFEPLEQISLSITRKYGSSLDESYTFTNNSSEPITITSLGIQTPFADVYNGAKRALTEAVHTHLFCGGSWAWVLAQPMSGEGALLGLRLRQGEIWGYSVESRNSAGSSNNRGHLVLQVTDFARNPSAFGGQPEITLDAGKSYSVGWEVAWFNSTSKFLQATEAPATFSSYSAPVKGGSINVQTLGAVPSSPSPQISITKTAAGYEITSSNHGLYPIEIDGGRTEVNFHMSLREAVQKRGEYIMRNQRAVERPGILSNAFLPVNTTTLLTQSTNGWPDWSDGSERIAMPLLLQLGAMRGWIKSDLVDKPLQGWADFAKIHLLDDECTPSRGSQIVRMTCQGYVSFIMTGIFGRGMFRI